MNKFEKAYYKFSTYIGTYNDVELKEAFQSFEEAIELLKTRNIENDRLKRRLDIYESPYAEKYKNMTALELRNTVEHVTELPLTEMLFVIGVIMPSLLDATRTICEISKEIEKIELVEEEAHSDVA